MILIHFWWWFQNQTGTNITPAQISHGGSHQYNFWSGWGSVWILPVIITLGHYLVDRFTHVCHVPGCYRKGKHPMAKGKYIVCGKHHPDVPKSRSYLHMVKDHKDSKK